MEIYYYFEQTNINGTITEMHQYQDPQNKCYYTKIEGHYFFVGLIFSKRTVVNQGFI